MPSESLRPSLSVVVTIIDGGQTLVRCLDALTQQDPGCVLEVLVPFDETARDTRVLAAKYPAFRFLPLGSLTTTKPPGSAAGQHELYDRRRSAGLAASTADVVAILEDRGVPRRDWAARLLALHERLPYGVIGGAIENGHDRVLNWAVYFCDFGRYQLPFPAGARDWVSDVNVGYKRRVLDATRELWQTRYHETTVHWALKRSGETLYLSPDCVIDQMRGPLRLAPLLVERFAWGRLFASTRAQEITMPARAGLALTAPLLPALLLARQIAARAARARRLGAFVRALPAIAILLAAWSAGEAVGYITGRG